MQKPGGRTKPFDEDFFTVDCPPGVLGLKLENSVGGPRLINFPRDSRWACDLQLGDHIVMIDGEDTVAMPVNDVAALLTDNSSKARTLTCVHEKFSSQRSLGDSNKSCFMVSCGAGKLGITLEDSARGPVLYALRQDSPLVGMVREGDSLYMINDHDCEKLSYQAAANLLTSLAHLPTRELRWRCSEKRHGAAGVVISTRVGVASISPQNLSKVAPMPVGIETN